jgi:hypothetical protein
VSEKKKFDGSVVKQAEAVAGDGTGVVTLIARNGKSFLSYHRYLTNYVCV